MKDDIYESPSKTHVYIQVLSNVLADMSLFQLVIVFII